MFCVECGREGPTLDGLCGSCFRKRNTLLQPPEAVDAVVCGDCGKVETGSGWARIDLEAAIPVLLRAQIPVHPRATRVTFTHVSRREDEQNLGLTVKAAAWVEGLELGGAGHTRHRVERGLCPTCNRRTAEYYARRLRDRAGDRARPAAR